MYLLYTRVTIVNRFSVYKTAATHTRAFITTFKLLPNEIYAYTHYYNVLPRTAYHDIIFGTRGRRRRRQWETTTVRRALYEKTKTRRFAI